jgi:hypothetical protein
MNTTTNHINNTNTNASKAKARTLKFVIGLLVASVLPALSANVVSAYTTTQSGYVGTVTVPTQDQGWYASFASGTLVTGAATASKASAYAAYDQYICSNTRLFVLSSDVLGRQTWTLSNSYRQCGWARGGVTNVSFSGVNFSSLIPYTGFSTDTTYTWQLSNNVQVGSKYIDMAHRADYLCAPVFKCSTGTSTIGGFIQFDF